MNRNLLFGIVGLLVLAASCCVGLFIGGAVATRQLAPTITAAAVPTLAELPSALPSFTAAPTTIPALTPTSTATRAAHEPPPLTVEHLNSPTEALVVDFIIHTEPGVDVFVTSASGTLQVGAAIPDAEHAFGVELVPDAVNHFVVAVRRTYEPYAGAQKNYDLLGQPLIVVQGHPPATPTAAPRWTAVPSLDAPVSGDLQELLDYLLSLRPSIEQALTIAQRDGGIVESADATRDDALLCDGRLAADALQMASVVQRMRSLSPPADAAVIHRLLLESGTAWADALGQIEQFCHTGNQLYKVPAVLKLWEAALKFQDASNRFWALVVSKGLEEWVQR